MRRLPQTLAIVGAVMLLATTFFTMPASPQAAPGTRVIAAAGDFGITMDTERNIDQAIAGGATGLLGLGDYNYEYSLRGWNAMARPLTSKGAWFALGNHDDLEAFKNRMPGQEPRWSIVESQSGVRIVAINTEESVHVGTPQYTWLSQELSHEAPSAPKILVAHRNWWLGPGADHPATEFDGNPEAMDALVAASGVDLVITAHEHNYQRTQRNAIPYLIVGTGGAEIDSVAGSDPATVATCACIGHVLLTLSSAQINARFVDIDGKTQDVVKVEILPSGGDPEPSGFEATFKNVRGNKNWVETDVVANKPLQGVDARVNNGAWQPLSLKSWGSWARAMTVPAGAEVQFRARANTGETVISEPYTWPPGSTTFSATFKNPRGNEWWVEVDVDATRDLAGVDMRKNSGAWIALAKKDWGSWAVSTHVPPGTNVQFRATSTTGDTALSSTYVWPPG